MSKIDAVSGDDELHFMDEPENESEGVPGGSKSWTILVVDDDPNVHEATEYFLSKKELLGRKVNVLDTYSGKEACDVLISRNDIDLVLLDCIMESANSGFDVATFLKVTLGRKIPIIVMRSGFSIHGVNTQIMEDHPEINAYFDKSEAVGDKLIQILEEWLIKSEMEKL